MQFKNVMMVATSLLPSAFLLLPHVPCYGQAETDDPIVQMVVELLNETDRDMRALALQQIREEVPGEAATKKFVELLPSLPTESQAGLVEALGDRGDPAARPAVLEMLKSPEETVRAATLKALGSLATATDIATLAERATGTSEAESMAAQSSLIRLRGEGVDAAIISACESSQPNVRAALLQVLAGRNTKDAIDLVLRSAEDSEVTVRMAALESLRFLADETNTVALVNLVKRAKNDAERRKAGLALLSLCSRCGEDCTGPIIAGLTGTESDAGVLMIRALARSGGELALEKLASSLHEQDAEVRAEAVRMLSTWPDATATPHLLKLAETSDHLRDQVLAVRGLVRLAGPSEGQPANIDVLTKAMQASSRDQEKRLVLGALGRLDTPEALSLVLPLLDSPALAEEANLAAVMIAERMQEADQDLVRKAMSKIQTGAQDAELRERAKKVMERL